MFDSARLLWLCSYHVSSIILLGAGKVGFENGAPSAPFQLAERADFFGQLTSVDTMIPNRGVVNARHEPLTGKDHRRARYHCILYDSNLPNARVATCGQLPELSDTRLYLPTLAPN